MSKRFNIINGTQFSHMILTAADFLNEQVDRINALNVFPVPDGDTGTNMNMTLWSGVEELKRGPSSSIGACAEALSKGLLMGARGNSGVILSQLFRGFAKSVKSMDEINTVQFAAALQQGVETAYQAVVKPVEGTILTVSREAARYATQVARNITDIVSFLEMVVEKANESLQKTPELLPVLKQANVVDSGGQGLVIIYEAFVLALNNEIPTSIKNKQDVKKKVVSFDNITSEAHYMQHEKAQAGFNTADIEYGYCTEFLMNLNPKANVFQEKWFRHELSEHGDSLLVVADDDLVKVHIHAELPGNVLNIAMKYGEVTRIKIDNMRDQHAHIIEEDYQENQATVPVLKEQDSILDKSYGMITVTAGDGIARIFESLGVDFVLSGGQTMNPSTEDLVHAIHEVNAKTIFLFPNNSNIILSANQAKELVEGKEIIVIPSKTIPQGLSAVLAFHEEESTKNNEENMLDAIKNVRSGQVTHAVRDSQMDELEIKEGDFLGIFDQKIVTSTSDLVEASKQLIQKMVFEGAELLTVISGEDAKEEQTSEIISFIEEQYQDIDVDVQQGEQPVYFYIFSLE